MQPRSRPAASQVAPDNPGFEEGDTGWTKDSGWGIVQDNPFSGTWAARLVTVDANPKRIVNDNEVIVQPGQKITAKCYVNQGSSSAGQAFGQVQIDWLDASHSLISTTSGGRIDSTSGNSYKLSSVIATAPAGAVYARIAGNAGGTSAGRTLWLDEFSWDYVQQTIPDNLVYKAVQASAGRSDSVEPTWPLVLGLTVVDNEVTWEAVETSRVVWEATPILVSGAVEPTFPTSINGSVVDNTIVWTAVTSRVEDENCPNSKYVVIAASKIFAGDEDIIPFSATTNPLDWSSRDDAGYIPFGLNTYGANPVRAMGLYRGNLVAFNTEAFQMWQVDQDPANMAILDAVPIGCEQHDTVEPFMNDLAFLNPIGVRNVSIAGASTNLQADGVGEPVDALVKAAVAAATTTVKGFSVPALGQFWLIVDDQIFVLTVNGTKKKSWSRYTMPEIILDIVIHGKDLYMRTETGKVWVLDETAVDDDMHTVGSDEVGEDIVGVIWWPFIQIGPQNGDASLESIELVGTAVDGVLISVGWDQRNPASRTADFLIDADTLPGMPVPLPVTAPTIDLKLTFPAGQFWEWNMAQLNVTN